MTRIRMTRLAAEDLRTTRLAGEALIAAPRELSGPPTGSRAMVLGATQQPAAEVAAAAVAVAAVLAELGVPTRLAKAQLEARPAGRLAMPAATLPAAVAQEAGLIQLQAQPASRQAGAYFMMSCGAKLPWLISETGMQNMYPTARTWFILWARS